MRAILALAVLLVSLAPAAADAIADMKAAAALKLKDPYSARFENLRDRTVPNLKGQPTRVICGFVNAKNSFGGYIGAQPFVYFVSDRDFNIASDAASRVTVPAMWQTFCS
jgi:hypothetical protein